jgi:hypothetical protein
MLFELPIYPVQTVWRYKSQTGSQIWSALLSGRAIGLAHCVIADLACWTGQIGPC